MQGIEGAGQRGTATFGNAEKRAGGATPTASAGRSFRTRASGVTEKISGASQEQPVVTAMA